MSKIARLTNDNKLILKNELYEYPEGKRNLVTVNQIGFWGSGGTSRQGFKFILNPTNKTAGLVFNKSLFKENRRYVLSFKIKKLSGSITTIGGHSVAFGTDGGDVYIDGNFVGQGYRGGVPFPNDTNEHLVTVFLHPFNPGVSDANLYIQPNRMTYETDYSAEIWDIIITEGTEYVPWLPSPTDGGPDNLGLSFLSDGKFVSREVFEYPIELEGKRNFFIKDNVVNIAVSGTVSNGSIATNTLYRGYYIPVKSGEVYSISRDSLINNRFDYGFTVEEPKPGVLVKDGMAFRNNLKIENIVVPNGYNWLFLYLSNNGDEIPNIKIERDVQSSKWTPAPEDLGLEYPPYITEFKPCFLPNGTILTREFSEVNDSLQFNGSDSYIEVSNTIQHTDFTWYAEVMSNNIAKDQVFLNGTSPTYIRFLDSRLFISVITPKQETSYCPTRLESNKLYRVAFVIQGDVARVYLNGELELEKPLTANPVSISLRYIGTFSTSGSSKMLGIIRNVKVFNRALSQEEIQKIHTVREGLVHYFPLDDGFGTVVKDRVGNATGTLINNPEWVSTL